ncbi:uncharacterized protein VICG_01918 [Vittaforma corneae ATCC 50505]|uniref:Methyltransferase type 11 domain-containing protein n=1 Tax=Vittaforma corneae (strain ATCC 50505) TaxID=993615 RepID=L2GJK1_VITCO|nr:uncharacterized protein VICG_01918 [Vittaforma corneae ATCC 50505]ELA41036.1 hypothetical protein VICG_01918 [Vittaforma corneae ATCC 50505]
MDFEKEYVHRFYSYKAQQFSNSRAKPWPFTAQFIKEQIKSTDLVLDAGCGNGRQFLHPNTIGLDYSANLLRKASNKPNIGLVQGDIHTLPFKNDVFDVILSIAVVHHLCSHERRANCLFEMKRVLKNKGKCLLYVWHKEASRKTKFSAIDGSQNEYFVSWRGEEDILRYYFLFDEESLENLVNEAGFKILEMNREQESIYAVLENEK